MTLPPKTTNPSPYASALLPPRVMPRPTPTPARPANARKSEGSGGRPLHIVMFAVVAVGLLVATAFVMDLPGGRKTAGTDQVDSSPSAYAAQAVGDVTDLAVLEGVGAGVGAGPLPPLDLSSQAGLEASLAAAIEALEAAIAQSTLPALPEDYVAGAEVKVRLPAAQGYDLPTLPSGPVVGPLRIPELEPTASPVGPRPATPLDDVLGQLEGVQATLEDLLGGLPTEDLGGLPVGGDLLAGTPLGATPEPVQDAGDAVEPDEQGALAASAHAAALLDATLGAYATTSQDLEDLLALYEGLAQRVQDAIDQVRELQEQAEQGIQATLEERLQAIEDEVAQLQAQAAKAVAQHRKLVLQAEADARTAVDDALEAAVGSVDARATATVADLTRQIAAVQAQAASRKAEIEGIVQEATGRLAGGSAEAQQALQAIEASAAAALVKVDRDAKSQVAALQQQVADVKAQAEAAKARLEATATLALADVNATVGGALATGDEVRGYLTAVATQQGELLAARETRLAAEAVTELGDLADVQVDAIVEDALAAVAVAEDVLDGTGALVADVEDVAVGEVSKDVDYLLEVAEDYGRVPTGERKERAGHWSGTASVLGGLLDDAVVDGRLVERLAGQVVSAAEQAGAEISALA